MDYRRLITKYIKHPKMNTDMQNWGRMQSAEVRQALVDRSLKIRKLNTDGGKIRKRIN